MSRSENVAFVLLGLCFGVVVAAPIAAAWAFERGHDSGAAEGMARGRCLEACLPDALIQTLPGALCYCDHDRLVRPRGKPALEASPP